jgi:putative FmdB family regulatory protein
VPTYVYRCQQCGTTLERRQGFEDPPLTECEECSGELRRVLQPVSVIFKGSGFYTTDYRTKSFTEGEAKAKATNGEEKAASSDTKEAPAAPAKVDAPAASPAAEPTKSS